MTMPADIRSFFGGSGRQPTSSSKTKTPAKKPEDASSSRKRRSRKVVEDSDEDEDLEQAPPPKPQPKKKHKPEEPKGEPTTTSAYFASSKKNKTQHKENESGETKQARADATPEVKTNSKPKSERNEHIDIPVRSSPSTRKTQPKHKSAKTAQIIDDEDDLGADDIFATGYRNPRKGGDDDYVEGDDSDFEDIEVEPPKAASSKSKPARTTPRTRRENRIKATESPSRNVRKRKSEALGVDEESDDYIDTKRKPSRAQAQKSLSKSAVKKTKATKTDRPENKGIQDIFDSIPMVRPPSPPAADGTKKFNFAQRSRDPVTSDTKELPVGAENCLAGLSFVFTGVLDTLGREEGQSLVKRYGGKVTSGPSSKTSYVVLGNDAGPKKLETIRKFGLKTINEDGLFELIRRLPANGGDGKAAEQHAAKKKLEEQRIKDMAAEIDREEKKRAAASMASTSKTTNGASKPAPAAVDSRLWTSRYAPTSLSMICGNKGAVEKLQSWLRNWRNSAMADFKKGGKDGTGLYRAVMIHGPPGIGKTTAAHLVAKLENYDVVESNASDTRSKSLVETGLQGVLDTTSLQGYFSGEGKRVESGKKNLVLIMDEVDGMSAGDRGGVGALAAVAKKTRIPMILICNERRLPKMRPFDSVTFDLQFRRPTVEQIRARLSTICYREGLKITPQVLDNLIQGTHADIRQVINMLSTAKLDQQALDYDQGKQMSKAWEKHVILKPWDIVSKILSAQMFSQSSQTSLNEKVELYFNDHEFSYLMLQENYLNTKPSAANSYQGREQKFKLLELADNAAQSISDGDLVDRMIHGTQQQWSLMPTHAVFSFVRPASFVAGNMTRQPAFTSWLGNNSKQGKMARQIKEIQGHMRLRSSGDRHEIRQQYLPALWNKLVRPLQVHGKDAVEEVIDLMDSYFLTREDWDSIVELGLASMDEKKLNIDSQTKATFTRLYNQQSHPLPFMKATSVVAPKHLAKVKPDLEDAIDESDEGEEILGEEETKGDESDLDLKKDKYVKLPKKTPARKGKAATKPQAKKTKKNVVDDDDEDDEEDVKPKKGARKARKPRGKA
ncbi:replication factor C subunit 1 [Blastomyces gilchristii SLH14081]|uniref:Replication factor C subunit 1 n=1 Tax=Blastomyces gilchristii (strain SLH14081) TaxID=559298 RepID=A0A179UPH2_BLAGS|nr:replication factor C subunit 1 [Blastomyces gilchristii SLH14081]OAT09904.1 replication factor C subunit 1 [Blastomyces gilchristii SLH14081]